MTGVSRRLWLAVTYGALASYFCWPLLVHPTRLGIQDWDYFFLQHAVVLDNVFTYGQLPFWNPWVCGGNVLWQNPQLPLFSVAYVGAPLVTLPVALKLNVLAHVLVGLGGMHLLVTRELRVTFAPAVVFIASLFSLAGGATLHLAAGHVSFLPYFYLPWQLFLYVRATATGSLRTTAAAGAMLALGVLAGGVYVVLLSAVGFGAFAIVLALSRRSWRPLVVLALAGLWCSLLSAPKMLPALAFLRDPSFADTRDLTYVPTPVSMALAWRTFIDPFVLLETVVPGQPFAWHEYGNYIGGFGALLVIASLVWTVLQRPWERANAIGVSLALTVVILFLLITGDSRVPSLARFVRSLPVFSMLRLPSRFTLPFTLFAASLVAWAMGRAGDFAGISPGGRRLLAAVFVTATLVLATENGKVLEVVFPTPAPAAVTRTPRPPAQPQLDFDTYPFAPGSPTYRAFLDHHAMMWNCYDPLQLRRVTRPDRPLVYAEGQARIFTWRFTPNVVEFSAMAKQSGGRVYLNQNVARGWTSDAGPLEIDPGTGQAYVTIDPDRPGSYAFRFVPPGLYAGLVMFVAGAAFAVALRNRSL